MGSRTMSQLDLLYTVKIFQCIYNQRKKTTPKKDFALETDVLVKVNYCKVFFSRQKIGLSLQQALFPKIQAIMYFYGEIYYFTIFFDLEWIKPLNFQLAYRRDGLISTSILSSSISVMYAHMSIHRQVFPRIWVLMPPPGLLPLTHTLPGGVEVPEGEGEKVWGHPISTPPASTPESHPLPASPGNQWVTPKMTSPRTSSVWFLWWPSVRISAKKKTLTPNPDVLHTSLKEAPWGGCRKLLNHHVSRPLKIPPGCRGILAGGISTETLQTFGCVCVGSQK